MQVTNVKTETAKESQNNNYKVTINCIYLEKQSHYVYNTENKSYVIPQQLVGLKFYHPLIQQSQLHLHIQYKSFVHRHSSSYFEQQIYFYC